MVHIGSIRSGPLIIPLIDDVGLKIGGSLSHFSTLVKNTDGFGLMLRLAQLGALCRFGLNGAHIENAFVSTSLCSPSRASILTGRYAHGHGVVDNQRPVPEGTVFFPKQELYCRNPRCAGAEFEEGPLSRTGTVWSFTEHFYQPPEPYVSPDPFVPYTVAAVELAEEKMVVLGQVAAGVESKNLRAGMEVELVLEKLYEDDENEYLVWKWKPVAA